MTIKVFKNINLADDFEDFLSRKEIEFSEEKSNLISLTGDESTHVIFKKYSSHNKKPPFAHINASILNFPFGEKAVEAFLGQEFGQHPEVFFRGILIKNSSLKVLDKASYGLYSDYICSEASELGFSTRPLRRYVTDFLMTIDRFSLTKEVFLPLNVDYGKGKGTFYCQFSCKVSDSFRYDFFIENIEKCLENVNTLEISLSPDGGTLLVRSYWYRNFAKEEWPSLIVFGNTHDESNETIDNEELVNTTLASSVREKPTVVEDFPHDDDLAKKHWRIMRKVLLACLELKKEYAANEKEFPEFIDEQNLVTLIKQTEEVSSFELLNETEKELIITCLNKDDSHDEFQKAFYEEMIEIDPEVLKENIKQQIAKSDLSKISDEPENTLVKGSKSEKEETILIKGSGSKEDNSIWKVKQKEVAKNLGDEYSKLDNPLPQELEKILTETLRKEISGSDEKLDKFVTSVVDSISEELLPESVPHSKFINKTMTNLKSQTMTCRDRSIEVPTLELKLMLSFTDKLIRKGKNYEENLKKESEKSESLKNQVREVTTAKNHDEVIAATEKNIEFKAKILSLERELELSKKSQQPHKSREGGLQEDMQKIVDGLNEDVKAAKSDTLDYKRQLKTNENEMVKLKTEMARMAKNSDQKSDGEAASSEGQSSTRVKHLEKISQQYQATAQKMEKEVSIKKKELHSARLEAKTLGNKVKALEKRLELISRHKAS